MEMEMLGLVVCAVCSFTGVTRCYQAITETVQG